MRLIESFKTRKLTLFNIFFLLYISISLVGGERGLVSYLEKKKKYESLSIKEMAVQKQVFDLKNKISLIKNNDLDYIDMLYREKLLYGKKDEFLINLK